MSTAETSASEDTLCDAEGGEVLLLPTRAEVVEDDAAFFDLISDLVDLRWEGASTTPSCATSPPSASDPAAPPPIRP